MKGKGREYKCEGGLGEKRREEKEGNGKEGVQE